MERLAGKVAIVTSASRGIGRACGLELAAEGAAVVVFVASDDADYITGATFMLDKGRVMHADARQLRYPDERGDLVGTMQEKWY